MTDKDVPEGKETPQDPPATGERPEAVPDADNAATSAGVLSSGGDAKAPRGSAGAPPAQGTAAQHAADAPVDAEPAGAAASGPEPVAVEPEPVPADSEPVPAVAGGATAVGADSADAAPTAGGEAAAPETSAMPHSAEAAGQADAAEQARTARLAAIAAAKRPPAAGTGARSELDAQAQRRNQAREAALTARPVLPRILQVVLAIAFPFILVIGAIKAIASPWFLWLDYHRPGFPADGFGFTPSERLTYGSYGVDYINNTAPAGYLGGLVDGRGNPLFLDTEVGHMEDVKAVIGLTYTAGIILVVLAVLICLYLGRRYAGGIRRGLFAGSVATIVIMAVVAVLGMLNWESFFTDFHRIFFSQGNWTFRMDDTLIRLYPPQFWVDAGITIAALVLLVSIVFLLATWPTARRRERSRLRQESRDFGLN